MSDEDSINSLGANFFFGSGIETLAKQFQILKK